MTVAIDITIESIFCVLDLNKIGARKKLKCAFGKSYRTQGGIFQFDYFQTIEHFITFFITKKI